MKTEVLSSIYHYKPANPFSFAGIENDVLRLKNNLSEALRLISWAKPKSTAILNLACGRADETGVLLETITSPTESCFYLGIDLRKPEIIEARKRWQNPDPSKLSIEFLVGDAANTHRIKSLPPFDVVFIRHQNYWDAPQIWDQIFHNALNALSENGILIFTSYFDREHELAMASLQSRKAKLLINLPNTKSRSLSDAPKKFVDRQLVIYTGADQIIPKIKPLLA
jgi:Methyltransferase domain